MLTLYTIRACARARQTALSDDLYLRVVSIGKGRRTVKEMKQNCKERTEHSDGKPAKKWGAKGGESETVPEAESKGEEPDWAVGVIVCTVLKAVIRGKEPDCTV